MDYATPLGIIALAGLVHASFQLGVSMMTLLSGHSLSSKRSKQRTLGLVTCFFMGAVVMTMLVVSFIAYVVTQSFAGDLPVWLWTLSSSLLLGLGIVVWAFYYRPGRDGTALWLPRTAARFLSERTKSTRNEAEAFSLGLTSVLAELVFAIPPALAAALAITTLPVVWQLPGVLLYVVVASLGLGIVVVLTGSGRRISTIQRWRESHKRFLQFAAGGGLLVLGFFIYVTYVVAPVMSGNF
jgi:MFS family permease